MSNPSCRPCATGDLSQELVNAIWEYTQKGFKVLPLAPNTKQPVPGSHGVHDATSDYQAARGAFEDAARRYGGVPNIGIACGKESRLVVVDLDRHGNQDGVNELVSAGYRLDQHVGPIVETPNNGLHLYFRYREGVRNATVRPGIELVADSKYVVAPPSTIDGKKYEWRQGLNANIPHLPAWFTDQGAEPLPDQGAEPLPDRIPEGQRNNTLASLAGSMRRRGASEEAILAALREENKNRCDPPLPDAEVEAALRRLTVESPVSPPESTKLVDGHSGRPAVEEAPLTFKRLAEEGYRLLNGGGQETSNPAPGTAEDESPYTDVGNAEYFAKRFTGRVCYNHVRRCWFVFRSPIWVPDKDGEASRLAVEALRERQVAALNIQDSEERRKAVNFLIACENGHHLDSLLAKASFMEGVTKTGDEFDAKRNLLAVQNGVLVLNETSFEFREGRPEDHLTLLAGTDYNPNATAPRWEQFVREVFSGDDELVAFVQRLVGYTLTGYTHEQVFVFCYGTGRNGKSTLLTVLRALLGSYAAHASFTTFATSKEWRPHKDELMSLAGSRLVTAVECKTTAKLGEDVLKAIVGEDPVTGSRKFELTFTYQPDYKVWLAANNLPTVNDVSDGFWRKVLLLPFRERFEGERQDRRLADKLKQELPGILNWALKGYIAYMQEGLNPPARCADAKEAWRAENDPLHEFLQECIREPKTESRASVLFDAYVRWCQENNAPQHVRSLKGFSQLMRAHNFEWVRRTDGIYFLGIKPPKGVGVM